MLSGRLGLRALTKILSQDRKEVRKIWYPVGLIEKRSKRQSADKKKKREKERERKREKERDTRDQNQV